MKSVAFIVWTTYITFCNWDRHYREFSTICEGRTFVDSLEINHFEIKLEGLYYSDSTRIITASYEFGEK